MRLLGILVTLLVASAGGALAACQSSQNLASVDSVLQRIDTQQAKYVFVGEHHGVGAAKRFAVDLTNALVDLGYEVGLYVEGFRTDCRPDDASCASLAQLFNFDAFSRLLQESKAPVHPIDPPFPEGRVESMAATIAGGSEQIRIVLAGKTHVVHAADPDAELWVYGGGLRYPDPGDLVEAFPREECLTVALEAVAGEPAADGDPPQPYTVLEDGCGADYALQALFSPRY